MPTLVPRIPDYPNHQKVQLEEEILDLAVTSHPLTFYRQALATEKVVPSTRLADYADQQVGGADQPVKVAGQLIASPRARTTDGKLMKFLTLEDLHGTMEVILFPDAYQKYGGRLTSKGPYLVYGTVRCQNGSVAVIGEKIRSMADTHTGDLPHFRSR
ncbi:MAG: OB-fold nucleic acid binding domain-containing protein [bacterium]